MMLACAIFAKSIPLRPFALINFLVLQYVGWQYKKAGRHERSLIGKNFRVFSGLFIVLGLSALLLKPGM
jgi:hypothetical protein